MRCSVPLLRMAFMVPQCRVTRGKARSAEEMARSGGSLRSRLFWLLSPVEIHWMSFEGRDRVSLVKSVPWKPEVKMPKLYMVCVQRPLPNSGKCCTWAPYCCRGAKLPRETIVICKLCAARRYFSVLAEMDTRCGAWVYVRYRYGVCNTSVTRDFRLAKQSNGDYYQ